MSSDYWEQPDEQVFVTGGYRFGVSASGRTVNLGRVEDKPAKPDVTPKPARRQATPVTLELIAQMERLAGTGMGYKRIAKTLKLANHMIVKRNLKRQLIPAGVN